MPRPKRELQIPDMAAAIKDAAWSQIASDGASALSLRAISRHLGITAPAIYNYYASRDELVTALVIDAFDSLAESQLKAAATEPERPLDQLQACGRAYRRWAISFPERYLLIFGPPLAGYQMPRERVLPSSSRSLSVLVGIVETLRAQGRLKAEGIPESPIGDRAYFESLRTLGIEADHLSLTVAVLVWSRLHGIVSLELSGILLGADVEALLNYDLAAIQTHFFTVER